MNSEQVSVRLKEYISKQVLDGKDIGLEADTPLLEWGVINSLEILGLLSFVREQLGVTIPPDRVTAETFRDIRSLTALITQIAGDAAA